MGQAKLKAVKKVELLKLDFGCGKHPREGFTGVDVKDFGQPIILDLTAKQEKRTTRSGNVWIEPDGEYAPWPWKDSSVEEAHASHFVEHLVPEARIHFVNELYRVLIPGGKCTVIVPHWCSCRAYGDLTHVWPPVSEFWFYYLSTKWRAENAPHNDFYKCDFEVTWGYNMHQSLVPRNQEYQSHAMQFWKEAVQDITATMIAKKE